MTDQLEAATQQTLMRIGDAMIPAADSLPSFSEADFDPRLTDTDGIPAPKGPRLDR